MSSKRRSSTDKSGGVNEGRSTKEATGSESKVDGSSKNDESRVQTSQSDNVTGLDDPQDDEFVSLKGLANDKSKQSPAANVNSSPEMAMDIESTPPKIQNESDKHTRRSPRRRDSDNKQEIDKDSPIKSDHDRKKSVDGSSETQPMDIADNDNISQEWATGKSGNESGEIETANGVAIDNTSELEPSQKNTSKSGTQQSTEGYNVEEPSETVEIHGEDSTEKESNKTTIGEITLLDKPLAGLVSKPNKSVKTAAKEINILQRVGTDEEENPLSQKITITMTNTGGVETDVVPQKGPGVVEIAGQQSGVPPSVVVMTPNPDGSISTKVVSPKQDRKKMLVNTKSWLKIRPKPPADSSVPNSKSVTLLTKSLLNKAKTTVKSSKSNKKKPPAPTKNDSQGDPPSGSSKRRRTSMLPARFRDYAVDSKGKGEMPVTESSGSESSTDSMDDDQPLVISPTKVATIPREYRRDNQWATGLC